MTSSTMHPCPECASEYTSALAAEECGEADRFEDLHARQMISGKHRATR